MKCYFSPTREIKFRELGISNFGKKVENDYALDPVCECVFWENLFGLQFSSAYKF